MRSRRLQSLFRDRSLVLRFLLIAIVVAVLLHPKRLMIQQAVGSAIQQKEQRAAIHVGSIGNRITIVVGV